MTTPTAQINYGANGNAYVASSDINAVRDVLLIAGFRCNNQGWIRESDGAVSAIFHHDNQWTACLGPTWMVWDEKQAA